MSLSDDLQIQLLDKLTTIGGTLGQMHADIGEMKGKMESLLESRIPAIEDNVKTHDKKIEKLQHRSWYRDGFIAAIATFLSAAIHYFFPGSTPPGTLGH